MIEDPIGYNSAYISLNLLDELDYYLGGYGKPNFEFLFSLNTFVETFIGSSSFYTSLNELNHLNLTTSALFPHGRPILNMVVKEGGLRFVNGVLNKQGKEIYRISDTSRKEGQQKFILEYGKKIQDQYLIKSDINNIINEIPLVTAKMEEDCFVVSEISSISTELVSNLLNVSSTSSIQTTLPLNLYGEQISSLTKTPFSIEALNKVATLHEANLEELKKSLNYRYLPIPPFTNILLGQVTTLSEIPQKLIQLRLDFQQLRDKFVELEQNIYESENVKKQIDAYNRFRDYWGAFNKKYADKRNRIVYGALDLSHDIDVDKAFDTFADGGGLGDAVKDLNVGKFAGNILKKGIDVFRDRRIINRFKGLTNIWELFQEGKGINQQLKHVERLFSIQFTNAEINNVHNYVKSHLVNLPNQISNQ